MITIKEYLQAAKATRKAESAPALLPPRPNAPVHAMPGPIASVALLMAQELVRAYKTRRFDRECS
jgi:hypothetical protein